MKKVKQIIEAHRFFMKWSHRYLRDKPLQWKTAEYYFPERGSLEEWYYPLSLKHKLYFPAAYFKFMKADLLSS